MKIYITKITIISLLSVGVSWASISDPVADYRSRDTENKGALKKVTFDWNGDGENDVCICEKEHYDEDIEGDQKVFWTIYVANATDNNYTLCNEQEEVIDSEVTKIISSIWFDPDYVFIGNITEINKHGLVSFHIDNPKDGDPIAYVYALVYKNGVFTEHELAKYNAKEENAVFDKYLKDDKRTQLTVEEIPAVVAEEDEQEDE